MPSASRILGQDRALDTLGSALRSGRFHHAWIFSGPRGVGKLTTALELARALLDPSHPLSLERAAQNPALRLGAAPLPASETQRRIDAGTHPDLHVIYKELAKYSDDDQLRERKLSNIPLGLLRERMLGGRSGDTQHEAAAYRTAAMGVGKVFIIDEAELLEPITQNAMLKTLEEPPERTWIFLITALPDRLLPTIHSRCQHVRFHRLEESAMAEWWKAETARPRAAADESGSRKTKEAFDPKKVPNAAMQWSLRFADGSPGLALRAMEYDLHGWQQTLDPMLKELDRGVFPVSMGETLGGLVEEFAQAWVKRHGEKETSKDAANKDGARQALALLGAHARSRLADAARRHGEDASTAVDRWSRAIDLLRACERQIDSNVNQKLAMENLVAQWAATLSTEVAA